MSWIAVDDGGSESIFPVKPDRRSYCWAVYDEEIQTTYYGVEVPVGTAEKLTGRPMTWDDDPRELM